MKNLSEKISLLAGIFCFFFSILLSSAFLYLITGFDLSLTFFLMILLFLFSLFSIFLMMRLNWVERTDWDWFLWWSISFCILGGLFVIGYVFYTGYLLQFVSTSLLILLTLFILYIFANIYVRSEVSSKWTGLGKQIDFLLILVLVPYYLCKESGFLDENGSVGTAILGILSVFLLCSPMIAVPIILLFNSSSLGELADTLLMIGGIGFLLYLFSLVFHNK